MESYQIIEENNLFVVTGRIGRLWFLFNNLILSLGSGILLYLLPQNLSINVVIRILIYIPALIFAVANVKKRVYDIFGESLGLAILFNILVCIPLINIIFGLYLLFKAGRDV